MVAVIVPSAMTHAFKHAAMLDILAHCMACVVWVWLKEACLE